MVIVMQLKKDTIGTLYRFHIFHNNLLKTNSSSSLSQSSYILQRLCQKGKCNHV